MDSQLAKGVAELSSFLALALSSAGSTFGCMVAGMAAVGAWKKCYTQNRAAPFQLVIFAGTPLSQTIYGFILMFMMDKQIDKFIEHPFLAASIGVAGGVAMGLSAYGMGKAAASACDSFAETGKGFANNLMILGIIETIAIFILIFSLIAMSMLTAVAGAGHAAV